MKQILITNSLWSEMLKTFDDFNSDYRIENIYQHSNNIIIPDTLLSGFKDLIEQYLIDSGGCDHSVGICACGLKSTLYGVCKALGIDSKFTLPVSYVEQPDNEEDR